MFDNEVLRWIFGPRRNEVTGEWRKLNNEELHNTNYNYKCKVKEDGMGGTLTEIIYPRLACCGDYIFQWFSQQMAWRKTKLKTPWSESTSELYQPSDRRLSAK
jgi:hypothetical protein